MPHALAAAIVTALNITAHVGFWTAVIELSIIATGTFVANALFGPELPKAPEPSLDYMARGDVQNQKRVYGEALVSGPLAYANVRQTAGTVDNEDLWQVVAHAGHECDSISDVYIDGTVITSAQQAGGGSGVVIGGTYYIGGHGYVLCNKHLGTATQTVDTDLDAAFTDIDSNFRGRGICYTVWQLELDHISIDVFKHPPNALKALVKGAKVYDPRLDSTNGGSGAHRLATPSTWEWSENPALCLADYLINSDQGAGFPTTAIDYSYVITAADHCDVTVSIPSSTEKRFTCNGVLWTSTSHRDNITKLTSSFNGRISYVGGQWRIRAGMYEAPSVSITDDDLAGDIKLQTATPADERFNTVRGIFVDPTENYAETEFLTITNANAVARDNGVTKYRDLVLPMTNSQYMAQRIGFLQLLQTANEKVVTIPTNLMGIEVAVGDTVDLTFEVPNYSGKIFRVENWAFDLERGVELLCREDSSSSYTDPLVGEYTTRVAGVVTPGAPVVPAPTSLVASSMSGGVHLAWVLPLLLSQYETIELYASSQSDWTVANELIFSGLADTFDHLFTNSGKSMVGKERWYWVKAIDLAGNESLRFPDNDISTITAIGGEVGTDPITSLTAQAMPAGIQLNWTNPVDGEFDFIRIYASSQDTFSVANEIVFEGHTNTFDHLWTNSDKSVAGKTRYYWGAAVNAAGEESVKDPATDVSTVTAVGGDVIVTDVTNLQAFAMPGGVQLTWTNPTAEPEFTNINLYASSQNDFNVANELIFSGLADKFDHLWTNSDKSMVGKLRYYWVRHVNPGGSEGPLHPAQVSTVSATGGDPAAISLPTSLAAEATPTGILVTWVPPVAEPEFYEIVLYASSQNNWTTAHEEVWRGNADQFHHEFSNSDKSLIGKTRWYWIAIDNPAATESGHGSNISTITATGGNVAVTVPTGLAAEASPTGIFVTWSNPSDEPFLELVLYASSQNNWTTAHEEVWRGVAEAYHHEFSNSDKSLVGKTRYYWIGIFNANGVEQGHGSNISTISATGGNPSLTQPATLTATTMKGGVFLSWSNIKEGALDTINLYASSQNNFTTANQLIASGNITEWNHLYTNSGVSMVGKLRYYWIKSVNANDAESAIYPANISTISATGGTLDYGDVSGGPPSDATKTTVFFLTSAPTSQGVDGDLAKVTIAGDVTYYIKEGSNWILTSDITAQQTAAGIAGQGSLATQNNADFATDVTGTEKPDDNATNNKVWFLTSAPTTQGTNGDLAKVTISGDVTYYVKESSTWVLTSDITAQQTAAGIAGQGALATQSTADFATDVSGAQKPANNADVTSANTAAGITGQGSLATQNNADFASDVTGSAKPEDNATFSVINFGNTASRPAPGVSGENDLYFDTETHVLGYFDPGVNNWRGYNISATYLDTNLYSDYSTTAQAAALYLGITATAADSSKLGGTVAASYLLSATAASTYLGISAKAADSELLDGVNGTSYARTDQADTHSSIITGLLDVTGNGIKYTGATAGGGTLAVVGFRWATPNLVGVVSNTTTMTVGTTSDHRLKDVQGPMINGLKTLKQIRTWSYKSKPGWGEGECDEQTLHYGVLAHEVADVIPSLVMGEKDESHFVYDDDTGLFAVEVPKYQSVNYALFTPFLIDAVKELSDTIDVLKAEIAELQEKIK